MNVFLSAGEASGDAYAAALVAEMRRLNAPNGPQIRFLGIGGQRFREAGAEVVADSSQWGALSILESAKVFHRVVRSYLRAKGMFQTLEPGLFVPIDFGFVNVRLARRAKKLGWKVLYFSPPGAWRRHKQGKDLGPVSDAIVTPFPWSEKLLKEAGANAHWFGHPIRQLLRERDVGHAPETSERTAVLPGSRAHEIKENLPLLAGVVSGPVEFGLAPATDVEQFKATWAKLAPGRTGDLFTQGDLYGVLTRCCAAIVCSGTATLEAALCRCPMIVIYRFPRIAELEAKIVGFKVPDMVSLPNIILQRRAIPELIQRTATRENLRTELATLLEDPQARATQLEAFDELETILGPADGITKAAQLGLNLVGA